MRWFCLPVLGVLAGCDGLSDDFSYSDEGWTLQSHSSEPTMALVKQDQVNGPHVCGSDHGFSGNTDFWRFKAPPKYLGNRVAAFGQRITWDAQTDAPVQLGAANLLLAGRGITIVLAVKNTPETTNFWRQFAVRIDNSDPSAQWVVDQTSKVATDADIKSVLSTLTSFELPGEWVNGQETSCIDNVYFGTP
jgi:hypothetical protein